MYCIADLARGSDAQASRGPSTALGASSGFGSSVHVQQKYEVPRDDSHSLGLGSPELRTFANA
jgi:hypothetical protein